MGDSGKFCCFGVLVLVVALVIMTIVLIATSLEKLNNKEVGLQYDTIQKDLDGEIFTEGLHMGPVGFEFIIFPNIYTTMTFDDISCLNSEGVSISLSVSYQYRVQVSHLKEVVMQFKDWEGYQKILRRFGFSTVYNTCSLYNTSQFQNMRNEFEDSLSDAMAERYDTVSCNIEGLQVNNINRPRAVENAIKSKERAKEDIKVARQERPRLETEAKTLLREAESEANIIINKAESEARILNQLAMSEAQAIQEQYSKEAEAYESIIGEDGLSFTPEGFISYMGVRVIADAKNPVHIGLNTPAKSSFIKSD